MSRCVALKILLAVMLLGMPPALAAQAPADKPAAAKAAAPLNLNTATAAQLEELPGIGAKTAALIVAYRQKTPFKKTEELMNIKGIGEKSFLRIRALVMVSPTKSETDAKASADSR
jgi:competence protein ComEA